MAYLYGASVQGIQEYIFQTNKLQEIVGASEIVKSIEAHLQKYNPDEILVNAAGNIKAIFKEKEQVEKIVHTFIKEIKQSAYGITISQAVVEIKNDTAIQDDINQLEQRLKIQRNIPTVPLDPHINILKQNPKTAKPGVEYKGKELLDFSSKLKRERYAAWFNNTRKEDSTLLEMKELTAISNNKNKIAVIHADGNGLGALIPQLNKKGVKLSDFSKKLDKATHKAYETAKEDIKKIRPIILGGDDMVVICDADEALDFTARFLEAFEKETKDIVPGNYLTACAGIAYCHEKFPFHYAVTLAEELCSQTKKHAKKLNEDLAPSSLMFHNIQSPNFHSWEKFIKDELTIDNGTEQIRCDYGPYYLNEKDQPKIRDFIHTVEAYRCEGSPISRLREWIGELNQSSEYANNLLKRINKMAQKNEEWKSCIMEKNLQQLNTELSNDTLIVKKDGVKKTPIYDVLQIISATEAKK